MDEISSTEEINRFLVVKSKEIHDIFPEFGFTYQFSNAEESLLWCLYI
jgi:hypothetical protein